MDIVYAAEKTSIADVLSAQLHAEVVAEELEVHENPCGTGSFLLRWRMGRFVLPPNGEVDKL